MEQLYIDGMDELLAKDTAFFHENFAGSLTKRVLSFASQFENFVDTLAFRIVANLLPLAFASVVLWRIDPLLVLVLLGMIAASGLAVAPLIRRRQALVTRARRRGTGCPATSRTPSPTWTPCAPTPRSAARPPSTRGGSASTAR